MREPGGDRGSTESAESVRRRLDEVLLDAAVLDPEERYRFFSELAARHPDLAAAARERLAAADQATSEFLEGPAAHRLAAPEPAGRPRAEERPGAALAPEARYELGPCLGQGGMGRVVEAYDRQLDRRVALKLLSSHRPEVRDLFLREGRAQARVRHPHVLDIYDSGELDGRPFLSMRQVDGGTLGEVATGLSLELQVRLLIQVAEGLHAAHRRGLLHRDVKPSNVLVEETPDGELVAYVSDFGIAQDLSGPDLPAAGAVAGSPQYIAPERLRRADAVDRRSDVYSLGVTMYRILTGALPHEGPMTLDVLHQTLEADVPPPREKNPHLPVELEAVVLRCLAKDPDERYASARAVAEDLRRFLDGDVVEAYATGLAYRVTCFVLRHRLLVSMGLISAAILVVASFAVGALALRADAARERAELRQGQAEELIRFMVVDLQEKLEPVSRLAVLDDVADAATEYFAAVPEAELSEPELLRRSRMLYQLGKLRIEQGDLAGAARPIQEALALTRRLHELDPGDRERLFELGQSNFWVGYVAWERGELAEAREAFHEYLAVSRRLVDLAPDDLDAQLELSYAHSNLGSVYQAEGRLEPALEQFERSLAIKRRLVEEEPENRRWRGDLAASYNTVGVALLLAGRATEARPHLERELDIRRSLVREEPENRRAQSSLATAYAYLGKVATSLGELERAEEHLVDAGAILTRLAEEDPSHATPQTKLAWAHIDLGRLAWLRDERTRAEREWQAARTVIERLNARGGDGVSRLDRQAEGALAYHHALARVARRGSAARPEVVAAVATFERLMEDPRSDLETARWWGWSYLLLAAVETSRSDARRALQRASDLLVLFTSEERTSAAPHAAPCVEWMRRFARYGATPAVERVPFDPLFCRLLAARAERADGGG